MKVFDIPYANEIRKQVLDYIDYSDIEFIKYITEITDQSFFLQNQDANICYEKLKKGYEAKKYVSESRDIILERTLLEINGHTFKIKPITLGEEVDFQTDFKYSIMPETNGKEIEDDDIMQLMMGLFADKKRILEEMGSIHIRKKTWTQIFKELYYRNRKDKKYYQNVAGYGMVKWLEKKVSCNGRKIKFYDLERKYGLTKLEIHQLMSKFMEISNFPMHLPKKRTIV